MGRAILLPVIALMITATSASAQTRVGAAEGREIAQRWCSACHVVAPDQTSGSAAVPTFMEIARRSNGELSFLEGFLADPHPVMPDMSLTRQEIKSLVAYIGTLR